ncbi:MAG: ribonuclease HII, partial [Candidatus Cloacimonadota bacterium]|nr:ribonuclease HII [Candidatus Cloacimonadota bacterium]
LLAGVDEAGRGPLAGPVVVAAVVLGSNFPEIEIDDSKKISSKKRDEFFDIIKTQALAYKITIVSPETIDKLNIFHATMYGMEQSVLALPHLPELSLIDGNKVPAKIGLISKAIVKGDGKYASIAAASILAKVTRDRIMQKMHRKYPQYNFAQHKGYPTKEHLSLLRKYGACKIHRRSYKPVREVL